MNQPALIGARRLLFRRCQAIERRSLERETRPALGRSNRRPTASFHPTAAPAPSGSRPVRRPDSVLQRAADDRGREFRSATIDRRSKRHRRNRRGPKGEGISAALDVGGSFNSIGDERVETSSPASKSWRVSTDATCNLPPFMGGLGEPTKDRARRRLDMIDQPNRRLRLRARDDRLVELHDQLLPAVLAGRSSATSPPSHSAVAPMAISRTAAGTSAGSTNRVSKPIRPNCSLPSRNPKTACWPSVGKCNGRHAGQIGLLRRQIIQQMAVVQAEAAHMAVGKQGPAEGAEFVDAKPNRRADLRGSLPPSARGNRAGQRAGRFDLRRQE